MDITITKNDAKMWDALDKRLTDYNEKIFGVPERYTLSCGAGGANVLVFSTFLYVDTLFVEEGSRKSGIGSAIMERIDALARELDFHTIYLLTYDFQGPNYYPRFGYREFGRVENYLFGHTLYYFRKDI